MKQLYILMLICLALAITGCRTQRVEKEVTLSTYLDSIVHEMSQNYVSKQKHEKEVERVIDSMKLVKLPVEQSTAVQPDTARSVLQTSLAISEAYNDKSGFLHHSITNKPDALLPTRTIYKEKIVESKDSIDTSILKEMYIKGWQFRKEQETVYVPPNDKPLENLLYYTGLFAWLAGIVYLLFKLRLNGVLTVIKKILK